MVAQRRGHELTACPKEPRSSQIGSSSGGRDFSPGVSHVQSNWASAPEVGPFSYPGVRCRTPSFSRAGRRVAHPCGFCKGGIFLYSRLSVGLPLQPLFQQIPRHQQVSSTHRSPFKCFPSGAAPFAFKGGWPILAVFARVGSFFTPAFQSARCVQPLFRQIPRRQQVSSTHRSPFKCFPSGAAPFAFLRVRVLMLQRTQTKRCEFRSRTKARPCDPEGI